MATPRSGSEPGANHGRGKAAKRAGRAGAQPSGKAGAQPGGKASSKQSAREKSAARAERAAQARREQQARERKRRLLMIGSVVVAVVLIVGAAIFLASKSGGGGASDAADSVPAPGSDLGVTIGSDSAPHQVVIYEDFLCPFCGALEASTRDDLTKLADDGQVQVEYRPFVLLSRAGDYSARSLNAFAIVMDTSGPEVAKKFHDLLYENQPEETGPFPDDDALIALAVKAGADESAVSDGITSMADQDFVDQATSSAQDLGISSTPTIYVDGKQFTDGATVDALAKNLLTAVGGS